MNGLHNIVELDKGVYWLGMRTDSRLEVNVYLRVFTGNQKSINMIIDPGPPVFFETLQEQVKSIIGDPRKVRIVFINHQDPDVSTNAMFWQKRNPTLIVICTEDTWRLTHFFGLNLSHYQAVDKFKNSRGRLSTGHVLQFIPTPFCHFRGSCMLYDQRSRILFSGDLFGGLSFSQDLYATPDSWDGIRIFHQIYMPSREAIRMAIDKIRKLKPAPKMIAPQHGSLIREDLIPDFLEKMYDLPVGLDLLRPTIIDKEIYLQAINEILEVIAMRINPEFIESALRQFTTDGSFPSLFSVKGGKIIDVKEDNILGSFKSLMTALLKGQSPHTRDIVKDAVLSSNWNLPLFETEDVEENEISDLLEEVMDEEE